MLRGEMSLGGGSVRGRRCPGGEMSYTQLCNVVMHNVQCTRRKFLAQEASTRYQY